MQAGFQFLNSQSQCTVDIIVPKRLLENQYYIAIYVLLRHLMLAETFSLSSKLFFPGASVHHFYG